MAEGNARLSRRLGFGDAVVIGLTSILGAGIFSAFAPAAAAAGGALLVGLAIAAVVAACNAASSAQLAAQFPTSGGAYVYGREMLGAWPGFLAGWSFVVGKSASCAAMALTAAAYLLPDAWVKPAAIGAVLVLAAVNAIGITRTAALARVLLVVVLAVLALVIVAGFTAADGPGMPTVPSGDGWYGVLQSAGLLFFAFAGYARVATLGEEVRHPARTIPRAILTALGIALVLYAAVGVSALAALGPADLAQSTAPLADVVAAAGWASLEPVVRIGAAVAGLGALLALLAGVGRTTLAMARESDLPAWLGAVHPRFAVPHHAEWAIAFAVSAVILVADLRGAIGFSSFGVLLYYLVANLAALRQDRAHRRFPRALAWLGVIGCGVLVITLPPVSVLAGLGVLAVGAAYRAVRLRFSSSA